jgi:hypothetical protein
MKIISKKIRDLENNVLKLPEDDKIRLGIDDPAEMALHERAERIKSLYRDEIKDFLFNSSLTFAQIEAHSQQMLEKIPKDELHIIKESDKFVRYRLMRLIYYYFVDQTSKANNHELWQRIVWFFEQVDDWKVAKAIEDSEWNFNRNEDDPDFDDFKWWDNVEAKIREVYPKGVFTQESYEVVKDYFDEKESEAIRQYWKANPEKFKEHMKQLEKKLESFRKSN